MSLLRVVFDTNVMVAGLRSRQGASFLLLSEIPRRRFATLVSVPLLVEYEATLKRSEIRKAHGLSLRDVDALLKVWADCCEPVHLHYLWRPQLRDPNDEMVLETAINGAADGIVSFNVTDFEAACPLFRVALWTPAAFLTKLRRMT